MVVKSFKECDSCKERLAVIILAFALVGLVYSGVKAYDFLSKEIKK